MWKKDKLGKHSFPPPIACGLVERHQKSLPLVLNDASDITGNLLSFRCRSLFGCHSFDQARSIKKESGPLIATFT